MPLSPHRPCAASPALTRVAAGDLCSGCGACAALAPGRVTMAMAPPGYLRPIQHNDLLPEQEAAIAAICPGLVVRIAPDEGCDDVLWGSYISARIGWSNDDYVRFAGASGGALTALASWLIDSGVVDAVVQVTADPGQPIANLTVTSETPAQVRAAAGSRYAPSAPLAGLDGLLQQHRNSGRRFAVVGKPCDTNALRAWTLRDPEASAAFPVSLSFFCGGVPSAAGAKALLDRLGVAPEDLIAFRYRGMGWPGQATALRRDGSEASMTYHDSWGGVLSRYAQHRCKICADSCGMAADIVCADAWEADAQGYPRFDEAPGISLILSRTPLGEQLIAAAKAAGAITTRPFDMARLEAIQPGQSRRRRAVLARLGAQRLTGRPVPHYRGMHLWRAAWQAGLLRNLRSFFGMLKRLPPRSDHGQTS